MAEQNNGAIKHLIGKIKFEGTLKLLTGMHIGSSKEFTEIGAVDQIVIRDPITQNPIIPGSSIKGKIRTLLAKAFTNEPFLKEHSEDEDAIKRLFGSSGDTNSTFYESRLQFLDSRLLNQSEIQELGLDLGMTEIKFENTIDRITAKANPRQIERVPAGSKFRFILIYNILDQKTLAEDLKNALLGLDLLQKDYIGGHGTRGYGRITFQHLKSELIWKREREEVCLPDINQMLDSINNYELLQTT